MTPDAAIVYSRYDLTCGLLGAPNPRASGLTGDSAYVVFSRLLLHASGAQSTSRPATAPAGDATP